MVQAKRNEAVKRMMDGRVNVLVATDVAARGLDILDITHVFNFDMPRTADTYHRIGRTGRAGAKAPPFRWWKRTTICCWAKWAVT